MSYSVWQAFITNGGESIVASATISVYFESSGAPATIYDGPAGAALGNTTTSGIDGLAKFYAPAGIYKIVASKDAFAAEFRHVQIGSASSRDAGLANGVATLDEDGYVPDSQLRHITAISTVLVPTDYATFASALVALRSGLYNNNAILEFESGYTITEQLLFNDLDMPTLDIKFNDNDVDTSGFVSVAFGALTGKPFFGGRNFRLGRIYGKAQATATDATVSPFFYVDGHFTPGLSQLDSASVVDLEFNGFGGSGGAARSSFGGTSTYSGTLRIIGSTAAQSLQFLACGLNTLKLYTDIKGITFAGCSGSLASLSELSNDYDIGAQSGDIDVSEFLTPSGVTSGRFLAANCQMTVTTTATLKNNASNFSICDASNNGFVIIRTPVGSGSGITWRPTTSSSRFANGKVRVESGYDLNIDSSLATPDYIASGEFEGRIRSISGNVTHGFWDKPRPGGGVRFSYENTSGDVYEQSSTANSGSVQVKSLTTSFVHTAASGLLIASLEIELDRGTSGFNTYQDGCELAIISTHGVTALTWGSNTVSGNLPSALVAGETIHLRKISAKWYQVGSSKDVLTAANTYADAGDAATLATATSGRLTDCGNHDASGNTFPSSGGSGTAGAIKKGDIFRISVAGALGGVAVNPEDWVRALVDTPGATAGNWSINRAGIPSNYATAMKIVGRNYGWAQSVASASNDIGGTSRFAYTPVGAVSKLAVLIASHHFAIGVSGGFTEATVAARNINGMQTAYEFGSTYTYDTLSGKLTAVIEPDAPAKQTDGVGINIPAGSPFFVRHYLKNVISPSGTPTAAAIAGGSLAAQAWYYSATRVENGVESGPTAEFTATTAGGNLSIAITIVDTRSASADYYRIYRSSSSGGTKQYLGSTNGPTKRFVDDGSLSVDSTINPPSASGYRLNRILVASGDCSSHVTGFGTGANNVANTGTFGTTGPTFAYGVAPLCIVGNDESGKSVLWLGDSIGAGRGFNQTSGSYQQLKNMIDLSFSDGEINSFNGCYPGSSLKELVAPTIPGGGRSRLKLLEYADHVVDEHGTNDLWLTRTWQELAADKLTLAARAVACGAKFYTTTLVPRVVTTDGCVTIAGQTPHATNEAKRQDFNSWVRAGSPVDGSGVPDMAGAPSPLVSGFIDHAATVEVNSSNVLTVNGSYWKVPTSPIASGLVLNGTPSTTSLPVTTMLVANAHVSRVIKMTSGARNGQYAVVASNTTSGLTIYDSGNSTAQSGIAVPFLPGAPAAGDTFDIYEVMSNEGVHPSLAGSAALSAPFATWIDGIA